MTANTSRRSCQPVPSIALNSTRLSGALNTSPCTLKREVRISVGVDIEVEVDKL
jgi:hypothetical protein